MAEIVAFGYSSVAVEAATELRVIAARVRDQHRWHIEAVVEIGKDLARAKEILGHGNFLPWLHAEFRWSERTARNYVMAAEHFGGKTAKIADLDLGAVYVLSSKSTPEPIRQEVIQRMESGERFETAQVKTLVQEAKEAVRKEQKPAKKTASQKSYQRRIEAKDKRERDEWRIKDVKRKAAAQTLVAFLRKSLGDSYGEFLRLVEEVDLIEVRRLLAS